MQRIPTRIHGMLDYALGILLLASPYLFGFADGGAAEWVPTLVGIVIIVQSLMTDYELGIARILPMPVHLGMDAVAGVFLAASPWLFGFAEQVWLPHLLLGLVAAGIAATTRIVPDDRAADSTPLVRMASMAETLGKPPADHPRSSDLRPATALHAGKAENADQLRRAIDSGATRDKVAVVDPAAAPLGTDAESGAPHDEEGLKLARSQGQSSAPPPS
ncbi:SPW repeat domain-containing protein [Rhodovastum atsumiense]|uniref:SPW repeat domain-containing protein n=1 Tax=Rhodovastum atsumiense TaxID=504468 RepID=UPI00193B56D4|nr:SPW repeat protein [Rhodovastum atsumiense]